MPTQRLTELRAAYLKAQNQVVAAEAMAGQAMLQDQPKGTVCEYRVVAVNRAGEGEPGNSVVVVL